MDVENSHVSDPAVLNDDKLVTLVREVVGTSTLKVGEVEERVPKFLLKHVTVWDKEGLRPYYGYRSPYACQ